MFGTANGLNGENVMTGLFGRVALGVKKGSFLGAQSYTGMLTEQLKAQEQSALSIINQYTGDEMLNQLRVAGATQGGLFAEISKNLDAVSGSAASARQYVTTLSAAMQNSAKAGGAFKNVLKGIGTSLLNWGTMMAATFIIGLVVDGIDQIVNRAKYAQEALDSMSSKFKENSDDLKKSNALIPSILLILLPFRRLSCVWPKFNRLKAGTGFTGAANEKGDVQTQHRPWDFIFWPFVLLPPFPGSLWDRAEDSTGRPNPPSAFLLFERLLPPG